MFSAITWLHFVWVTSSLQDSSTELIPVALAASLSVQVLHWIVNENNATIRMYGVCPTPLMQMTLH